MRWWISLMILSTAFCGCARNSPSATEIADTLDHLGDSAGTVATAPERAESAVAEIVPDDWQRPNDRTAE